MRSILMKSHAYYCSKQVTLKYIVVINTKPTPILTLKVLKTIIIFNLRFYLSFSCFISLYKF